MRARRWLGFAVAMCLGFLSVQAQAHPRRRHEASPPPAQVRVRTVVRPWSFWAWLFPPPVVYAAPVYAAPPPPPPPAPVYPESTPPPPPPPGAYPAPPPAPMVVAPAPSWPSVVVGADAMAFYGGGLLGAKILAEGSHWGVGVTAEGMGVNWAGRTYEGASLLDAQLTYALVSTPEARVRLEGGVASAWAPGLGLVGGKLGVSGLVWLGNGPLGIDGSLHGTAYPFTKLDAQAGLVLRMGPVWVRGGWRQVYLEEGGLLDGVAGEPPAAGPYVGLALAL